MQNGQNAPAAPVEIKKLKYELTLDESNLILRHLDQGKHGEVAPLIQNILQQAQAQLPKPGVQEPTIVPAPMPEGAKRAIKRALKGEPKETAEKP